MPSHFLHGLAKLFSFGRRRQPPASRIDEFPVYRPEMPDLEASVELDATKRVLDDALREATDHPPARGAGSDATQRLPWPARDAHLGQPAAPSLRTHAPARPPSGGGDDATMLVANTHGHPAPPGDRPGRDTSDATVLVTSRKRPPE